MRLGVKFYRRLAFQLGSFAIVAGIAWPQTNPCDLNNDGRVTTADRDLAVDMALGLVVPCTANIYGPNVCNVIVVQRVVNAITGPCITGVHSVSLNWTASTSPNVSGYNVYRSTTRGGPYTKANSALVSGTTYTDAVVQAGLTYYYVATAVDTSNQESVYSNEAPAAVPSP